MVHISNEQTSAPRSQSSAVDAAPTPWREVNGGENIADKNGMFVANILQGISSLHTPTARANADLIVKAVNAHDALVEAAKSLIDEIGTSGTHQRWKRLANVLAALEANSLTPDR